LGLSIGVFAVATAAETRSYVGSKVCAECHPTEFRRQSASAHAQALSPASRHNLLQQFASGPELRRDPGYRFRFSLHAGELSVTVFDAGNYLEIPVQWAFGAGHQAVTFVSRIERNWYLEHAFTYYSALHRMGPTPGHEERQPNTLVEAAGFVYKTRDPLTGIVRCFACHATGPVDAGREAIQPAEPGVHCEACHGPGSLHARAGDRKRIDNPGRMTAVQRNVFCGGCHRPPEAPDGQIDWNFAWNVRHQPSYLRQSACFRKSNGALSCLTCHDPHDSAEHETGYYNRICTGCHREAHRATAGHGNCVDCHMPMVSPQPPLRFANHWIGIYSAGARLKPISAGRTAR